MFRILNLLTPFSGVLSACDARLPEEKRQNFLSVHKVDGVQEQIEATGATLLNLPPPQKTV